MWACMGSPSDRLNIGLPKTQVHVTSCDWCIELSVRRKNKLRGEGKEKAAKAKSECPHTHTAPLQGNHLSAASINIVVQVCRRCHNPDSATPTICVAMGVRFLLQKLMFTTKKGNPDYCQPLSVRFAVRKCKNPRGLENTAQNLQP